MKHGFLLIDKPRGPTSHDTVSAVRRSLHERSIGHLGTLDPMAEGLMVLAVGAKALKAVELFMGASKEYVADVRFGAVSTTYDAEGALTDVRLKPGVKPPADASTIRVLIEKRFLGRIRQTPPEFSAISIGGERAYAKARRGEAVDLPPREVEISACDIVSYQYPDMQLRVACGSGTYIRSIANDIGEALSLGAYLKGLRRTKVGDWRVENAVRPDAIRWTDVIPLKNVLADFPRFELRGEQWDDIRHGRPIVGAVSDPFRPLIAWFGQLPVALLEPNPKASGTLKPRKVL